MFGNKQWLKQAGAKLLSDTVIFSMLSSNIPLDFHESIQLVQLEYLIYF